MGLVLAPQIVIAHPGKLDANGCHTNSTLNRYECHTGPYAGRFWPSKQAFLDDTTRPAPVSLTIQPGRLVWDYDPPQIPVVFRLYWQTELMTAWHGPITVGDQYSVPLPEILRGATYSFYVTAYRPSTKQESAPSNIVTVTVPGG